MIQGEKIDILLEDKLKKNKKQRDDMNRTEKAWCGQCKRTQPIVKKRKTYQDDNSDYEVRCFYCNNVIALQKSLLDKKLRASAGETDG